MKSAGGKRPVYRVPSSEYWPRYWNTCLICSLATFQLLITFAIVGMEIGNALVDIYKANIFSGFWSFPFTISATFTTYACVCTKKTQTKATVALIFQLIAIIILLAVIGFLITFISSDFTLCFGFQCNQTSTTFVTTSNTAYITFSSTMSATLKRVFIICELVCSVIFIVFSIIYIILFIKCLKRLPRIHPLIRAPTTIQSAANHRLTSSLSRPLSISHVNHNQSDITKQTHSSPSATSLSYGAQKVCPNCQHISPYNPNEDTLKCPKCDYQSNLVEHAQQ